MGSSTGAELLHYFTLPVASSSKYGIRIWWTLSKNIGIVIFGRMIVIKDLKLS